jgi:hypothetical protein
MGWVDYEYYDELDKQADMKRENKNNKEHKKAKRVHESQPSESNGGEAPATEEEDDVMSVDVEGKEIDLDE